MSNTQDKITLAELKRLSALTPVAGRKYPRPGYEKLILTRYEDRPFIDLDGTERAGLNRQVDYYLTNEGGTLKKWEYAHLSWPV